MPFDSPPGQVLSSVPPSSDKRRSSKIAGCAGVLFQIFHGKRLFPRKSLPAERPKTGAINHTDEKLPIAKLLLIADENRGGSVVDTAEGLEEENRENVPKDESCEEKAAKRTPSVVARLMGLDSMPASEPVFGEKKQPEPQRRDTDCRLSLDVPKERHASSEKTWKTSARVQPYTSLHMAQARETKTSLPEKFPTHQKASIWKDKAKDDVAKSKVVTKSPSLPPHHLDSSFPSVVSSSKKGDPINRSSMRSQRTAHLLEAAARMLEASTHRNTQTRKQRLQSSMSRSRFGSLDAPKIHKGQSGREQVCVEPRTQVIQQLLTTAVQAPSSRREETKPSRNSNETMSRRQNASNISVPDLRRPQAGYVGPEQVPGGRRGTLHEAAPVKRKQGYQPSFTQPRANLLERVKPDWRRQEETSRRLSQPATCNGKIQRLKSLGTTRLRHPSPPKSCQDSCSGPCSSQASNSTLPSSEGMHSSQPTGSRVGSNNTPSRMLSSSSVKGISAQREDAFDGVEVRQPSQSVYSKTAGLPLGNLTVLQDPSISVSTQFGEADNSSYSQDGSISSAIYTECHRRSSMESLLSSDPSLSEFTTSSEECSSFLIGAADITRHERVEGKWEGGNSRLNEPKRALDIFVSEDSSQSKLESLSTDRGDTASSHTLPDADARRHDSVHTYSGKNTAAILQELLTALSSSTTSEETFTKPRVGSTESYSSDSDLGPLEKPHILPGGHSLYAPDSQDSASCNSDGSEISQSCKPCEPASIFESMDCTNIVETQAEEEASLNMEDTVKTHIDHEVSAAHTDFVDCEALMSTLSKLHHIDPEAIGLNVRATKRYNKEKVIAPTRHTDGFSGCLVDPVLFNKLEEQVQQLNWGLSNSATLSAEDDADSAYRSDLESSFRNGYEEVAAQNKKLVTDCINEAFKSLSRQLYGFSSSISGHSSASQVLSRVYKQIDEWRGMAVSMNLDDMVEKEMNLTTRRWRNIGAEAEDIAEVVESTILSGLMEEVLLELI